MSISSSEWLISVRRSSPKRSEISVQLLLDHREHARLVAEDRAQLGDPLGHVGVLLLDRVGLERGQLRRGAGRGSPSAWIAAQLEALDQLLAGGVAVARGADQFDDRVEVVERDQQALEDVRARLLFGELVLRAADDRPRAGGAT